MCVQKGANPNVTGGELASTPIHWATRQGHLSMVILLLRYGSNPETLDAEGMLCFSVTRHASFRRSRLPTGLNCLQIAAQFGFTNIIAYYITCHIPMVTMVSHCCQSMRMVCYVQSIDCRDSKGRTPLMLAATRAARRS